MKKIFIIGTTLFLSFNVKAMEIKPYISSKINFNFLNYNFKYTENINKSTFSGSIAIGLFNFNTLLPLRTEFEFSTLPKVKKVIFDLINFREEVKINTYYLNFYCDCFNVVNNFVPYLNLGFGLATATINLKVFNESAGIKKTKFSWQVGAGSYYKINNNLFTDLGIKYNKTLFNKNIDLKNTNVIVLSLGLRYNF